jgi:hypothetical protein
MDYITPDVLNEIAAAVVTEAAKDWRRLCKSATPSTDCNFAELDEFFQSGCRGYIDQDLAEKIYTRLKQERSAAERGASSVARNDKYRRDRYVAKKGKVIVERYATEEKAWESLKYWPSRAI